MGSAEFNALNNVPLVSQLENWGESGFIKCGSHTLPVYKNDVFVVGTGAAGMRAAVELARRDIGVTLVTTMLFAGTSACSGSDKQTLFTCSTSNHGDDVLKTAQAIGAGGAMDGDLAYIEAANSYLAMDGLRTYGLPLPIDRYGAVLRYQTDHDEAGRATSCGPRTSRLMVKVLSSEAARLGVTLLDGFTVIKLIVNDGRANGAVVINRNLISKDNPYGFAVLQGEYFVLAGGGAGLLYRDSVYPEGCVGTAGVGLEAGLTASNLQEMQFGIGTDKTTFPWNLSGTYMQVIPDVFSVDPAEPDVRIHFLEDYYRTTAEICSNIFRKGYQWPIHAERMLNYGSSLFDLAVYREKRKGRKVYLDFRENYQGKSGDPFDLEKLDDDVKNYLKNADAFCGTPIKRLEIMNKLAIALYEGQGIAIRNAPLEFNVNHQHFNGGLKVDSYARTAASNVFAIGECAGTHGVTRPGGAALNSGQVFALRAAEYIKAHIKDEQADDLDYDDYISALQECLDFAQKCLGSGAMNIERTATEIQTLMSDRLGFIVRMEDVRSACSTLKELRHQIAERGLMTDAANLKKAFEWRTLSYEAEAVGLTLLTYLQHGGGSRGARVVCESGSTLIPQAANVKLQEFALKREVAAMRSQIIDVSFDHKKKEFCCNEREVKPIPDVSRIFFEKNWNEFLEKRIFD